MIKKELRKAIKTGLKATTSVTKKKVGAFLLNKLEGGDLNLLETILYDVERVFSHRRYNVLRRDWVEKMPASYQSALSHLANARSKFEKLFVLAATKGKTLLTINQVIKDGGNKECKKNYQTYKFFKKTSKNIH